MPPVTRTTTGQGAGSVTNDGQPEDSYVGTMGTIFWALVIGVLGAALVSALVNIWPVVDVTPPATDTGAEAAAQAASTEKSVSFFWGAFDLQLTKSTGLIVLAIVAGALGSFVQASMAYV